MEKALKQLEKLAVPSSPPQDGPNYTPPLTKLVQVLLGITPPSEKTTIPEITFFDPTLNDSQKEAVRFALESPEVACIHGPPGIPTSFSAFISSYRVASELEGTGKTHTLIEVIRQLTRLLSPTDRSKRILVCGASNLSVDNILERLLAIPSNDKSDRLKVTRIGHPARVMNHEGILECTLEVKAGRSDQVISSRLLSYGSC